MAASNLLSKQFSNFFNSYSKAFNKKYERRGSLFLKNFKKKAIAEKEYLTSAILYTHLNPVKHGFIFHPKYWKWSSYHTFHLDRGPLVTALFESEKKYFRVHEDKIKSYTDYDTLDSYFLD